MCRLLGIPNPTGANHTGTVSDSRVSGTGRELVAWTGCGCADGGVDDPERETAGGEEVAEGEGAESGYSGFGRGTRTVGGGGGPGGPRERGGTGTACWPRAGCAREV